MVVCVRVCIHAYLICGECMCMCMNVCDCVCVLRGVQESSY